jgi:hypothetical protein
MIFLSVSAVPLSLHLCGLCGKYSVGDLLFHNDERVT